MFSTVYFEIAGKCNGMCPWCTTGSKNRNGRVKNSDFISLDKFKNAIKYMIDKEIISKNAVLNLFDWGEPFLHPDFEGIIKYLNEEGIFFSLSTNASIPRTLKDPNVLKNLKALTFSMPGFSQDSYDKIHGFDFEKITNNIKKIVNNFRECGFSGYTQIAFHAYQFNLKEIKLANEFARELDINILPYCAYFNGFEMYRKYLKSEMEYSQLYKASRELILYYIDEDLIRKPEGYKCPQITDILTIDENCNVLTCCAVEKGEEYYSIGNLFSLSSEDIRQLKNNQMICTECSKLGIDYLIHNIHIIPSEEYDNSNICNSHPEPIYDLSGCVLPSKGCIDAPRNEETITGEYTIRGWFTDGYGIRQVDILIDNNYVGKAVYGDLRPDVKIAFPEYKTNCTGFHYVLNASKLTKGKHYLVVRMVNFNGDEYFSQESLFYTEPASMIRDLRKGLGIVRPGLRLKY